MSAELRDDVWDDLDDEVLVVASNLFSRELGKIILTNSVYKLFYRIMVIKYIR